MRLTLLIRGGLTILCGLLFACASPSGEPDGEPEATTYGAVTLVVEADVLEPSPSRLRVRVMSDDAGTHVLVVDRFGSETVMALREGTLEPSTLTGLFSVHSEQAATSNGPMPAVLGSYTIADGALEFRPRYPFDSGRRYRTEVRIAQLQSALKLADVDERDVVVASFVIPAEVRQATTTVTQVYPTADTLPANLLKFYIHFSAPMTAGAAYDHLSLIDEATGVPTERPFVEMQPELWDPDRRRFTLLFDPGRIKRDVGPNVELGPPLQAGHSYRLVVDTTWRDARGVPVHSGFEKRFTVESSDRNQPEPDRWRILTPVGGTYGPVELRFQEPLDHALLQRVLSVFAIDDERVVGSTTVGPDQRSWAFTPDDSWVAGAYEIRVEKILEDLAGNSLRSLFDVDLHEQPPSADSEQDATERIPFTIRDR